LRNIDIIQFGEFDLLAALAERGVDMALAEVATVGRCSNEGSSLGRYGPLDLSQHLNEVMAGEPTGGHHFHECLDVVQTLD
jgi:hypothetical protein